MTKQEFLDNLYDQLSGEVPSSVVSDNVNYYRNYIDGEINSGKSEYDVLDSLGNPRLIAKTIIDTCQIEQQTAGGDGFGGYTYGEDGGVYRDETEQPYGKPPKLLRFSGWIVLAVVVLFILLILNIIFFLPGIFWWLLLAWLVYRWFRRRA